MTRLRAQGTLANSIKFASISVSAPAGSLSATGSYDLNSRSFQVDAKGAGIDIAKFETLHVKGSTRRQAELYLSGSGTLDDPRIEATQRWPAWTWAASRSAAWTLRRTPRPR